MKYFFLVFAVVAVLFVGIFGLRGQKFSRPPLRIFPDMDEQDEVKAQMPDDFFADGMGSRLPVAGTHPRGFLPDGATSLGGIPEYGYGGGIGYYETGKIGGAYGNGMPEELGLTEKNVGAFLRRGQERFGIFCSRCHGDAGDGKGITSRFGVPVDANPNANLAGLTPESYPQGQMFETITKGKGNMGAYGYTVPLRDRWAIIAYVRALQERDQKPETRNQIEAPSAEAPSEKSDKSDPSDPSDKSDPSDSAPGAPQSNDQ